MLDRPLSLVTGATGFVGSAVARVLAARGHRLRVLARANSDRRNLVGLEAEMVIGDLSDPGSLARAASGCRYVFHVAADYRIWVPDPEAMMAANVAGSVAMLRAGRAAGVERMVYCSSVAALGTPGDGGIADETSPASQANLISVYRQSKYRAEQAVLELVRDEGAPVVIVNPAAPVGPRDIKPTPTGKMIREAAAGRMPVYLDTGLNVVHVDDVAEGHALALERGRIGEKYILGGQNFLLGDLVRMICEVAGKRGPFVQLPGAALWPLAIGSEAMARWFGVEPMVTRDHLRIARKKMFYSSDKARRELGFVPRPAREAVVDAVAWMRANGILRA